MASDDKEDWENEIDLEDDRMNKHKVWHPVPVDQVPSNTNPSRPHGCFKRNRAEEEEED